MLDNETALINGSLKGTDEKSVCVGVAPDATPEVESQLNGEDLQSGGSVENALSPTEDIELSVGEKKFPRENGKEWFVLRITYDKIEQAKGALKDVKYYYPSHKVYVFHKRKGKKPKRRLEDQPLIKNLLFVYINGNSLRTFLKENPQYSFITYCYDHCQTNEFGKNPPMTIRYDLMINFVNATMTDEEDTKMVNRIEKIHFKSGALVEVTDGKFKGVKGWVIRLGKQQRVLVRLNNFLNFATSYIPDRYISPVYPESANVERTR